MPALAESSRIIVSKEGQVCHEDGHGEADTCKEGNPCNLFEIDLFWQLGYA